MIRALFAIIMIMTFINTKIHATVQDHLSESEFDALFPMRTTDNCLAAGANTTYTYANFISAASWFPDFVNEGSVDDQKRELAAFLAQTSHETGGGGVTGGYCYTKELYCQANDCSNAYSAPSGIYPSTAGKIYYGRGAIQLSWNYNYGKASQELTGSASTLLNNPEIVATSDWAFKTAIWYWMDNTETRPSPHRLITGLATGDTRGNTFAAVTNAINGGLECLGGPNQDKQDIRIAYYEKYVLDLGISVKPASSDLTNSQYLNCSNQPTFHTSNWLNQNIETNICLNGNCGSSSTLASSSAISSSSVMSSSSRPVDAVCERTAVADRGFNFTNGDSTIAGYQINNYTSQGGPFSAGEEIIPAGEDCNLSVILDGELDDWNLYSTTNWAGLNKSDVGIEKITWVVISSSSMVSSSSLASSSSSAMSSSSLAMSSSSRPVDAVCERTTVPGREFNFTNNDSTIAGYLENNYVSQGGPFSPGDEIIPVGEDCNMSVILDSELDDWNLYSTTNWTGTNKIKVRVEKINWITSSSSSSVIATTYTIDSTYSQGYEIVVSIDSLVDGDLDTLVTTVGDSIVYDTLFVAQDSLADGVSFWNNLDTVLSTGSLEVSRIEDRLFYSDVSTSLTPHENLIQESLKAYLVQDNILYLQSDKVFQVVIVNLLGVQMNVIMADGKWDLNNLAPANYFIKIFSQEDGSHREVETFKILVE